MSRLFAKLAMKIDGLEVLIKKVLTVIARECVARAWRSSCNVFLDCYVAPKGAPRNDEKKTGLPRSLRSLRVTSVYLVNKVWLIIFTILFISGCTGERCIEADDFGFANLTVSARYNKEELFEQFGGEQVAPWRDSSYRVNGRPLAILVRSWTYGEDYNKSWELSAWCAWYGDSSNTGTLSKFCERLQDCQFIDGRMCSNTKNARISNAPCLFRNGVGLYALIATKETDPNESFTTMLDPNGLTFHLGDKPVGYEMLDISKKGKTREAGGMVYKYEEVDQDADDLKRTYADSKLYFKILDKFYDDNNGQYRISIKSGITETNPDPIGYLTNLVKKFLFGEGDDYGLIRRLYMGIINNPGFRLAVSALLTLYIIFTGFEYLTGNINISHTELIVRILKIAVVSALLSTQYSWSFFNDYLFVYFIGGLQQLLQAITEAGSSGPGSPTILGMMIAPQTLSKLFAVLFVDWMGFIYIILFFFALYFVLMIFLEAAVIYLTALIAIGMIITMAPIFICFLLFGITKSLFENWLRQLISYTIQPVILFTGLIFISIILRDEIYGALGFRVCKHDFPSLNSGGNTELFGDLTEEHLGFSMGDSIFYWWFPQPMKGEDFVKTTSKIPIPIDHFDEDGKLCEAYGCVGDRYPDLPFLDPNKDQRRLNNYWNGKFVQLDGLLLIFVAIYLLHKFNGTAVSVARFIGGTSGNLSNISAVGGAAVTDFRKRFDQLGAYAKAGFARTSVGRAALGIKAGAGEIAKKIQDKPSELIDKARIASLKKDALSSQKSNKSVLTEVKLNTGLNQEDLKQGAIKDYKNEIATRLKTAPDITDKQAGKIAAKLSQSSYKNMPQNLAQIRYGKSFGELSKVQQDHIKDLLKDKPNSKSIEELSKNAMASRRFQEAYVGAYQNLSNRGVGLLGKRIGSLQKVEELDYRAEQRKKREEEKQRLTGEILYAGYEGLKSGLYEKATGNKGDRSEIGTKYFGGSYHQIDPNSSRKQTYAETLEDQKLQLEQDKIERQIRQMSIRYGDNISSPEFLARQDNTARFDQLNRESIKHKVYKALTDEDNPVLMGSKYMKDVAKDSELVHMIDRAKAIKQEIMQNDEFINRQDHYESVYKLAGKNIEDKYDLLKDHYGRSDIKPEEMPALLKEYYFKQGYGGADKAFNEEAFNEVKKLKQNIEEFDQSQAVLQKIDERKQMVSEEVDKHVNTINKHRKNAGMEEYQPQEKPVNTRRIRKIEDYLRDKK